MLFDVVVVDAVEKIVVDDDAVEKIVVVDDDDVEMLFVFVVVVDTVEKIVVGVHQRDC